LVFCSGNPGQKHGKPWAAGLASVLTAKAGALVRGEQNDLKTEKTSSFSASVRRAQVLNHGVLAVLGQPVVLRQQCPPAAGLHWHS